MEKIKINTREEVEAAMQMLQSNNYIEEAQQLFDWWKTGHTNGQDWKTFNGLDELVEDIRQQQVKKAERKAKAANGSTRKRGRKNKSKDTQIDKLPKDMAEKSGWLAISEGVNLTGIDKQIFMAKVMQMFAEEMLSSEYSEMHGAEIEQVKKMQNEVNELTAKIQPTLDKIANLKNEISNIQKQWDKRTKFQSQVAEYTYILHNNSNSDSETIK